MYMFYDEYLLYICIYDDIYLYIIYIMWWKCVIVIYWLLGMLIGILWIIWIEVDIKLCKKKYVYLV